MTTATALKLGSMHSAALLRMKQNLKRCPPTIGKRSTCVKCFGDHLKIETMALQPKVVLLSEVGHHANEIVAIGLTVLLNFFCTYSIDMRVNPMLECFYSRASSKVQ
eukprot:3613606-Amphidinium_carterae.1